MLGVNDLARQGALRFKDTTDGEYLSPKNVLPIPPLVNLPKSLVVADKLKMILKVFKI